MEEEYGRTLQKLARNTAETYAMHEGKAGSVFFPFLVRCAFPDRTSVPLLLRGKKHSNSTKTSHCPI